MSENANGNESPKAALVCAVAKPNGEPCGRKLHHAPNGVGERSACLMHSKDPTKSKDEFCLELQRIISEAEKRDEPPDFTEFVFPACSFKGKKFPAGCAFIQATFTEHADFSGASFAQGAFFFQVRFLRGADFSRSRFIQHAVFMESEFLGDSLFEYARFESQAVFMSTKFHEKSDFIGAEFLGEARFGGARFKWTAQFDNAKFRRSTEFNGAKFARLASFERALFEDALEFHETRFRHDFANRAGLDFNSVELKCPERVRFYRTDLGQALFYYTDISSIDFALAEWRDRGRIPLYRLRKKLLRMRLALTCWEEPSFHQLKAALARARRSSESARICLFEEDVYPFGRRSLDLETGPGLRNLGLIAEMYQQLKRNFDAKGDYWTAGHWHYGEMEMKRLCTRTRWRPLRWLGRHFSLVALYKYASAYGESYMMPLVWLFFVVVAFSFAFPIPGLEFNPPAGSVPGWLGYVDWSTFFRTHPGEHPVGFWGMILHGFMTSLSVAGFQRELRFAPSYPWGRMLALLELLLTTTLGGLFLLAIRRQFKRS